MKFRSLGEQAYAKRARLPRIPKFCQCSSKKQNFKRYHKVNIREVFNTGTVLTCFNIFCLY